MPYPCPHCAEAIAVDAKFCPRCGKTVTKQPPVAAGKSVHKSVDFGKMSAPIPVGGIVFLAALVLGPAALIAGLVLGVKLLVFAGVTILIGLALLLVLGHFL